MRMLTVGDSLGCWVVSSCMNPGVPRLYAGHRHDDEEMRVLITTLPKQAQRIDQLRREASILRDLDHPAVPALVDFGLSREHAVVWMATAEFRGETLQDRLLSGPLPWKEACRVFHAVAEGLRYVHAHDIVHRDVHPGKILLGQEQAKIVGFESALHEGEAADSEVPLGPVGYLAPEVITFGAEVGPRADLYALGVSFFEALTGRPAFPAALMDERVDPRERMLDWKARSEPLRPTGDIPEWLGNLVAKATHPDPKERLPDLDAFVGWLEAARGFWEPEPAPVPAPAPATPPALMAARPSIAPLAPRRAQPVEPSDSPSARSWMAMAYTTGAGLGIAAGLVFGVLVILLVELPALG